MLRVRRGLCLGAFLGVVALGCGLRSTSDSNLVCTDDGDTEGDTEGEVRVGSCDDPFDLPNNNFLTVVKGVLGGCSDIEGWCGGRGGEDVYRFISPGTSYDVWVRFVADGTDIDPIIRVFRSVEGDACAAVEDVAIEDQNICAPIEAGAEAWAFWVTPGYEYYLVVDAPFGESGEYEFEYQIGPGQLADNACLEGNLQEQEISLGLGGEFQWNASLDSGQGVLDGPCGGPGDEDIFVLNINEPGTIVAEATSTGGAEPLLSLRSGCSASTELACDASMSQVNGTSNIAWPFGGPATVYLAVDSLGVDGGDYSLNVRLE